MEGYGQYCPISRAAEILDGRWTIQILRDLLTGATRYTDLIKGNPGLSRALLSRRLDQLIRAGIVEREDDGSYRLTAAGADLRPLVFGMAEWGARWAFGEPLHDELDPDLLLWWLHRRIDVSGIPGRRFVIHVRFRDHTNQYWIVVEDDASVCLADPLFDVDVKLVTDLRSLYRVYLGHQSLDDAVARKEIDLRGASEAIGAVEASFRQSPVADIVRAASPPPGAERS